MKHKPVSSGTSSPEKASKSMGTTSTGLFSDKGMGKCYKPSKDSPRISRA